MNLHDRIKLIDDMIRENRDLTIGEYYDLLKEMEEFLENVKSIINK